MSIKQLPISQIGLSNRSHNALRRAGVHTVGQLLEQTEESIHSIRNIGEKSVREIMAIAAQLREQAASVEGKQDGRTLHPFKEGLSFSSLTSEEQQAICRSLDSRGYGLEVIPLLPVRAYNTFILHGITHLSEILFKTPEELRTIDERIDSTMAELVCNLCANFLKEKENEIAQDVDLEREEAKHGITVLKLDPSFRDALVQYVQKNDVEIELMNLSVRSFNCLKRGGFAKISEIILLDTHELQRIHGMGRTSVEEIQVRIDDYLLRHESRIRAYIAGDSSTLLDDDVIKSMVMAMFLPIGFEGLRFADIEKMLSAEVEVSRERIYALLGELLSDRKVEYVDYRFYRVYGSILDCINECSALNERTRTVMIQRLNGATLEAVAQEFGLTRERVRQIVSKGYQAVKKYHASATGSELFDEDYYRDFYAEYDISKQDAEKWFGLSSLDIAYLGMIGIKRGEKPVEDVMEETSSIYPSLRLRALHYLNRDKIFVDDRWVDKKKSALEEAVLRKYCEQEMSFDNFVDQYNEFLREIGIPEGDELYHSAEHIGAARNRLSGSRYVLWKQNERLRYYDIDSRDYDELIDSLQLDSYENVEISTLKLFREYPQVMAQYDIRDQYELHNLLRKILKEGDFHNFYFGRMPILVFGVFDRKAALMDLLSVYAPIGVNDFAQLVEEIYGFDRGTVLGSYLQDVKEYNVNGVLRINEKKMDDETLNVLKAHLPNDFYFLDEIRKLYQELFPDGDLEEVNGYNLKRMGFVVFERYALQHFQSLIEYFQHLLTEKETIDISGYRKRYTSSVSAFSTVLMSLKRELDIIEYDSNQIISIRRLEKVGVTKEALRAFCEEVFEFVGNEFFSIQSLKNNGFRSSLFELGFSDVFYSNVLLSDSRFSYSKLFGTYVFKKGNEEITRKSFGSSIVQEHGKIDIYDLMNELETKYGCTVLDRSDLIYEVPESYIYYDKVLERFYASYSIYEREISEMGERFE